MMNIMARPYRYLSDSIVVFTGATIPDILAEKGSGNWVLNARRAAGCKYLVCCRRQNWNNMENQEPNGAAFLIGIIKKLVPKLMPGTENRPEQQRYFIEISRYAQVRKEGVWKEWRNPVRYNRLEELGVDVKSLKFESVEDGTAKARETGKSAGSMPRALTIAEAKAGLAVTLGINPDDIEIHIRG